MITQTLQESTLPAYIELFELDCSAFGGSTYRFTNSIPKSGNAIQFGGETYMLLPVELSGLDAKSDGTQSRPTLSISNVSKVLLSAVISLGDIVGAKFTRHRTFEPYLDSGATPNPTQKLTDVFFVAKKTKHNKQILEFELCSALEKAEFKIPRRQVLKKDFPGVGSYRQ